MPRAVDAYKLTLLDGVEHEFYFTNSVQRKATQFASKCPVLKDIPKDSPLYMLNWAQEFFTSGFYEACSDKGTMTLEDFSELLPGDTSILTLKWEEMKTLHSRPWMPADETQETPAG